MGGDVVDFLQDYGQEQLDEVFQALGVPGELAAVMNKASEWAASFFTGNYMAIATDLMGMLFGSGPGGGEPPIMAILGDLDKKLDKLIGIAEKTYNLLLESQYHDKKQQIEQIRNAIKLIQAQSVNFANQATAEQFQKLVDALQGPEGLAAQLQDLLGFEFNQLPVAKTSYSGNADWFDGGVWPGTTVGSGHVFNYLFVTLQPATLPPSLVPPFYDPPSPDPPLDARPLVLRACDVPEPATKKPPDHVEYRWDGRFSLPVILMGLAGFERLLRQVEPYHRSTGNFAMLRGEISGALGAYLAQWARSFVWTVGMPFSTPGFAPGFEKYPCRVVDAVMGVASPGDAFWISKLNAQINEKKVPVAYEGLDAEQAKQFEDLRRSLVQQVASRSGYANLFHIAENVAKLAAPPASSECLEALNHLRTVEHPAQAGIAAASTTVSIETNGSFASEPKTFQGVRKVRPVRVRLPVYVQPNPRPTLGPPTAASLCEFGYALSVSAVGASAAGEPEEVVFASPLRMESGDPGLFHDASENLLTKGGSYTAKAKVIALKLPTYDLLVNAAGTRRMQHGAPVVKEVSFACAVTVLEEPQASGFPPDPRTPPRAALIVEVFDANPNYTYDLQINVIETVPATPKPFRVHPTFTVDGRVIEMPDAYFKTLDAEAATNKAIMQMIVKSTLKFASVLPSHPSPPEDDPFGGFEHLLRDPGLAGVLVHEAEKVLDLRGSKARLLDVVRRARAARNRVPRVQAFVRPQLDTEIGFPADLLVAPAPGPRSPA